MQITQTLRLPGRIGRLHQYPQASDLLERMLLLDPRERLSITEVLAHPFLGYEIPRDSVDAVERDSGGPSSPPRRARRAAAARAALEASKSKN